MGRFDWFVPKNDFEVRAKARAMAFYYSFHPDKYEEDKNMLEPDWFGKAEDTNGVVDENDLDDHRYNQIKDS